MNAANPYPATVYNILNDNPTESDLFLIDTNVWLFSTFSLLSVEPQQREKAVVYQNYLKRLRAAQSRVIHTSLQLAEVANVIERELCHIRGQQTIKDFRKNKEERAKVIQEIKDSWSIIKKASVCESLTCDHTFGDKCLDELDRHLVDAYDVALIYFARETKCLGIITDDADLAQVNGLSVFTYNQTVLRSAKWLARKKDK